MAKEKKPYYKILKWLYPNLGLKRYFFLMMLGILLIIGGLGSVYFDFMHLTGGLASVLGVLLIALGLERLNHSVCAVLTPDSEEEIVEMLYTRRHLARGPKIVVLGGGSGLSPLLKGLKQYTSNLTAIVTVGDDGGSSGQLRRELGVLPPGDVRNCLVALAEKDETMEQLFSYRFDGGTLKGHTLGNLLLAGLEEQYGDFRKGVEQLGKIFALRGKVYPSTLDNMTLEATFQDGRVIQGETALRSIPGKIETLRIIPDQCRALPEVVQAVEEADLVVLGPGSLYTSILPNLMVGEICQKIRASKAPCLYICNMMTERGETDNFTVSDHLKVLERHCEPGLIDVVIASKEEFTEEVLARYIKEGAVPVRRDPEVVHGMDVEYYEDVFYNGGNIIRHDPEKLAKTILKLFFRMTPSTGRGHLLDIQLMHHRFKRG